MSNQKLENLKPFEERNKLAKFKHLTNLVKTMDSDWLLSCHNNPGDKQSAISRLAVRNELRKRKLIH